MYFSISFICFHEICEIWCFCSFFGAASLFNCCFFILRWLFYDFIFLNFNTRYFKKIPGCRCMLLWFDLGSFLVRRFCFGTDSIENALVSSAICCPDSIAFASVSTHASINNQLSSALVDFLRERNISSQKLWVLLHTSLEFTFKH